MKDEVSFFCWSAVHFDLVAKGKGSFWHFPSLCFPLLALFPPLNFKTSQPDSSYMTMIRTRLLASQFFKPPLMFQQYEIPDAEWPCSSCNRTKTTIKIHRTTPTGHHRRPVNTFPAYADMLSVLCFKQVQQPHCLWGFTVSAFHHVTPLDAAGFACCMSAF